MVTSIAITAEEHRARCEALLEHVRGKGLSGVVLFDPYYVLYYAGVAQRVFKTRGAVYYSWFAGFPSAADFIPPQLSCAAFAPASPDQNTNFSGFCDRSIDAQMNRATAAQVEDPAAATTLWQEVEQSLLAQAPVVPAYNRSNVDFVSKRVGNYQYNPQCGVLLDQLWVK